MIKILIVDDDYEKIHLIIQALKKISHIDIDKCLFEARDANTAKRILTQEHIDLLLLDIQIPLIMGDTQAKDGGIQFLQMLKIDRTLNCPKSIIGITGYDEIFESTLSIFDQYQWTLLKFDRSSDEWIEKIKTKIDFLSKMPNDVSPSFDIAIITALNIELDAILALPCKWQIFEVKNDPTIYHTGIISIRDREISVIACTALRMGMSSSAALTMKMSILFKPKYLFMTGIAAGVRMKSNYGDILIADPVWDWGNGKFALQEGQSTFQAAPHQISISSDLRSRLKEIATTRQFLDEIKAKFPISPSESLQLHIGPIASGASVLADPSIAEKIRKQHRELIGLEMEAYGVMSAVEYAPNPRPIALVIKSVCDFADTEKNDQWQKYAAHTSAMFMYLFISNHIHLEN